MSVTLPLQEESTRAYHNFIQSLKSQETKELYRTCLIKYLNHYKKTTLEAMLTLPILEIENNLIDYLLKLKEDNLSRGYINVNFCALKHFYFMNDVRINKEKIGKFLGEQKKKHVDRSYTHAEIKSIFDLCDLRFKVVVLILASTGIRIGGLPSLQLRHIEKKEYEGTSVYKFTIYENTKEEYITFCSPECAAVIDSYFDFRKRSGEKMGPQSYLIREQFDVNDLEQIRKEGSPVAKNTIANILLSLAVKAGLRKVNHNYTCREREPVPIAHGFRKFFTTQLTNARVNPVYVELMLGHHIGVASSYMKPTDQDMLEEYLKGIDNLTINEENKLRREIHTLKVEKTQYDRLAAQVAAIEQNLKLQIG